MMKYQPLYFFIMFPPVRRFPLGPQRSRGSTRTGSPCYLSLSHTHTPVHTNIHTCSHTHTHTDIQAYMHTHAVSGDSSRPPHKAQTVYLSYEGLWGTFWCPASSIVKKLIQEYERKKRDSNSFFSLSFSCIFCSADLGSYVLCVDFFPLYTWLILWLFTLSH